MITYEELLAESDDNRIIAKEKPLPVSKGRIKGNRIAIQKGLPESEKKCVLAEELGHYYTAAGNILDQNCLSNRKQELRGRVYAYERLVGLKGIVDAYHNHCTTLSESAEYLDVTEEFLSDALRYYKGKYGIYTTFENYVIFFEPTISVLELRRDTTWEKRSAAFPSPRKYCS